MRLEPSALKEAFNAIYSQVYFDPFLPFSEAPMALFKPGQLTSLQTQPFID
jgi:hypothetical protein